MGEQKGQIPKEIGFKAAVGIPVIYNDTLVAILEFRSTTAREINQDVITFFSNVATRAVVSSAISDSVRNAYLPVNNKDLISIF
jgi:hypothetical protein